VRKAWTWLAGGLGLAALARARRRSTLPAGAGADYAEDLRRKLAERRAAETGVAVVEEADAVEEAPEDLDARRARVHARAQEAIDLMRDDDPAPVRPEGGGSP
jgi:hypothetical protein